MTRKIAVATAIAALAAPAAAEAHVTLQPSSAQAGAFTVLNVRVPNERDNKSTAKVDLQFPGGFTAARYEPKPGWRVRVVMGRLATPIQTDDGPITEGVRRMVWTRTNSGGGIKPGQFIDFPISVQIPGKAGDKLTFKALQTYGGGEVVRWIGAADSDLPAPQLSVTAAQGSDPAGHGASSGSAQPGVAASSSDDGGSGGSDGLSIAALVAGGLGLVLGGGALAATRRRDRGQRRSPATA